MLVVCGREKKEGNDSALEPPKEDGSADILILDHLH
jgi:hypothetical protein